MATVVVFAFESPSDRDFGNREKAKNLGSANTLEELNAIRNANPHEYFAYWDPEKDSPLSYAEAQALMGDFFWIDFLKARSGL